MKKRDIVKLARQESARHRLDNVRDALEQAADCYRSIRAFVEVMDGTRSAIAGHIKSHEDWEYFLDAFRDENDIETLQFEKFNTVRCYSDGEKGTSRVELLYEPLNSRYDGNNILFGVCTFEDIENIEGIIRERKGMYND